MGICDFSSNGKLGRIFEEVKLIKELIVDCINNFFAKWALIVYRFPCTVIFFCVMSCICFSVGLLPGIPLWLDGAENLYSLPHSVAREHNDIHRVFYGDVLARKNIVIITHVEKNRNILTWGHLEKIKKVDNIIRGIEIDPVGSKRIVIPFIAEGNKKKKEVTTTTKTTTTDSGSSGSVIMDSDSDTNVAKGDEITVNSVQYLSFEDICLINTLRECSADSVLKMGLEDWRSIHVSEEPEIYVFDGLVYNSRQNAFVPEYYLGGATRVQCVRDIPEGIARRLVRDEKKIEDSVKNGFKRVHIECITGVQAYLLVYDEWDKAEFTERNMQWEEVFIQVMKQNKVFYDLSISIQAYRSRDDELKSSTAGSNDVVFVVLTFIIVIAYSAVLNFSCDLYKSKSYPALAGVAAATMGLVGGMGLVSLCRVPMVPTVLICPFLVIGIGVDDMFVIVNSYSLSYMISNAEDRCAVSLRDCGISITITTLTNLISFGIGAFSPYLSIRNFCIYSAVSLFMGYLYVLTFFFAFMCLDAKREDSAKVCCCCLPIKTDKQRKLEDYLRRMTEDERKEEKKIEDISTYSLVTYKVRINADDKAAQKSNISFVSLRDGARGGAKNNAAVGGSSASSKASAKGKDFEVKDEKNRNQINKDLATSNKSAAHSSLSSNNTNNDEDKENDKKNDSALNIIKSTNDNFSKHKSSKSKDKQIPVNAENSINDGSNTSIVRSNSSGHESISTEQKGGNCSESKNENKVNKTSAAGAAKNVKNNFSAYSNPSSLSSQQQNKEVINVFGNISSNRVEKTGRSVNSCASSASALTTALALFDPNLARQAFYEEPKGNVGRKSRLFFLEIYGPFLMNKYVKVTVLVLFFCIFCISIFGFTKLEQGLNLTELAPSFSYLRNFDAATDKYFTQFDQPIDIFFPSKIEWWKQESLMQLQHLHQKLASRSSSKMIINSLLRMLQDENIGPKLKSGNKEIFTSTLYKHLSNSKSPYKQFEYDFIWQGKELITWRFKLLPKFMKTSEQRAAWMKQIREDCGVGDVEPDFSFTCIPFNFMMIFYESDLQILSSVIINMIIAAITMLLVAFALIPELIAGLLVIFIIFLIDATIFGFMYFWDVKLNMVSSIALVISIGFAVDYSAHLCHTFTHCEGDTRNLRVIESLVLMGSPIFHGAISTLLGIIMLGFSTSYVFGVFFKMMVMVIIVGAVHGVLLLPVLLSYIGPIQKNDDFENEEDEETNFGGLSEFPKGFGNTQVSDGDDCDKEDRHIGKKKCVLSSSMHDNHYNNKLYKKNAVEGILCNSDAERIGGRIKGKSPLSKNMIYLKKYKDKCKNKNFYAQNTFGPANPLEVYYYNCSSYAPSGVQIAPHYQNVNLCNNNISNVFLGEGSYVGGSCYSDLDTANNSYSEISAKVLDLADLSAYASSSVSSFCASGLSRIAGREENSLLYSESHLCEKTTGKRGNSVIGCNYNCGEGENADADDATAAQGYFLKPNVYGLLRHLDDADNTHHECIEEGEGKEEFDGDGDQLSKKKNKKALSNRNNKIGGKVVNLVAPYLFQDGLVTGDKKSLRKSREGKKYNANYGNNILMRLPNNNNNNFNGNYPHISHNLQSSPSNMRYSYIHKMVQRNRVKHQNSKDLMNTKNKVKICVNGFDNETEMDVHTPGSSSIRSITNKISSAFNFPSYASYVFNKSSAINEKKAISKNIKNSNSVYNIDSYKEKNTVNDESHEYEEVQASINQPFPSKSISSHPRLPLSEISIDYKDIENCNILYRQNSTESQKYNYTSKNNNSMAIPSHNYNYMTNVPSYSFSPNENVGQRRGMLKLKPPHPVLSSSYISKSVSTTDSKKHKSKIKDFTYVVNNS